MAAVVSKTISKEKKENMILNKKINAFDVENGISQVRQDLFIFILAIHTCLVSPVKLIPYSTSKYSMSSMYHFVEIIFKA